MAANEGFFSNPKFAFMAGAGVVAVAGCIYYVFKGDSKAVTRLQRKEYHEFEVIATEDLSHDAKRITFALEDGGRLGLQMGQHISIKATLIGAGKNGKDKIVSRPYTPVSSLDQRGSFTIVVKKYEDGLMSGYLHDLAVGDTATIRGPVGKDFVYQANEHERLVLCAGGSGITPILQVAQCIANDPQDSTPILIVYSNKTEADILCRDELETLQDEHPEQVAVVYTLTRKTPRGWTGETGHITAAMLESPAVGAFQVNDSGEPYFCICGPPAFNAALVEAIGEDLNCAPESIFEF